MESGLQAISSAAVFLARARNIPLGARIDAMGISWAIPGFVFLDVVWTCTFQSSLAMALPAAKPNRKARRKGKVIA